MNKVSYEQFFGTLAGNRRIEILQYLHENGAQNVSDLAAGTGQEQSALSHNLRKLLACQCVHVEVRGKHRYYSLNDETVVALLDLVDTHLQNYCQKQCGHCSTSSVPGVDT